MDSSLQQAVPPSVQWTYEASCLDVPSTTIGNQCSRRRQGCMMSDGGGFGMTPWCDDLVCSWRHLLANRHSLPFPWSISLHRRWCPSASHHPLTFLFLPALTFALPFPFLSLPLAFPSVGGIAHRPHHTPSLPVPLVGWCQRIPRTCPTLVLCVKSTQRKTNAFAVGQVRPSGHPKPAVRYLSPTAAGGPWNGHLRGRLPNKGT